MKKITLCTIAIIFLMPLLSAQQYASFSITGNNQGSGTTLNAALPAFNWIVEGTLNQDVQVLDDEYFEDGSAFEYEFGQADDKDNLRIQVVPNGAGTVGQAITSMATLTITFNSIAPADLWGFCLVDIDVENALISATDANDNPVPANQIDEWLVELMDVNTIDGTQDVPKWDAANAALLGSDTPEEYTVYNNIVIGGMPSSEAPAAYFMPNIPIKSLVIDFENLQALYSTSYHFYIASLEETGIPENQYPEFSVYPNPCRDKISIRQSAPGSNVIPSGVEGQNSKLEIVDLNGRVFYESGNQRIRESGSQGVRESEMFVDVSRLPAGLYLVKLQTEAGVGVRKIVKR